MMLGWRIFPGIVVEQKRDNSLLGEKAMLVGSGEVGFAHQSQRYGDFEPLTCHTTNPSPKQRALTV